MVRLADMLGERGCEWRIASLTIEGDVAGLSRIGNEGADARIDLSQSLADARRTRAHGACQIARKRIVAAGIEEHDIGLVGAAELHLLQNEIEIDGVEVEVALVLQLGIDRNEVVAPGDLQPVSRIEEDSDVGVFEQLREAADARIEIPLIDVDAEHDVEPGALERRRYVVGIVDGVGERGDLLVGRVADHQRHALLGGGR